MKICIAHNRYKMLGGEDRVVAAEAEMLVRDGHQVEMFETTNEEIRSFPAQAAAAVSSFFSLKNYGKVQHVLQAFQPDVLHVHNFMPTLSPAVFFAASSRRVPVVQTLHNYRLLCANAELFHAGQPCERCVTGQSFLPGVRRACYRGSRAGSAVVGGTMALHDKLGTWKNYVSRYIALTEFAASKLGGSRVPKERIRIKPNFVADAGEGEGSGGFALFAGRLSGEKGIQTLIDADATGRLAMPVYIAGDGPEREQVHRASSLPGSQLVMLGPQTKEELQRLMKRAELLIVPSLWFEGFPMVIVEAFACGVPVLASRIGSLGELVCHGETGLLHDVGSPEAIAQGTQDFVTLSPERKRAMRRTVRDTYLSKYNEGRNCKLLLDIYEEAVADARARYN